jgi:signal transduction histidine kinase/DNA-binding response OmpR family regulator/HPt (histidine-containing phosphotransfer) domain-containing protein
VKFRNSQGHTYHLIISSRAEANKTPHFLVIVQDVSERVQLKRLLDQHEHSFEHLARNTPGMIYKFTISPDGHAAFPYASPGSQDIWEIDPAEVRTDATPIIKLVHPEDLEGFQGSVMKSAAELSAWEYEGRMITPSGKLKWFHAASRPELAENGDIVWQGLLMDVTHQKAIEEELKSAKLKAESAARSKADFLANMSHEIRTPMNGVIGMAELLANTELASRQKHYVDTIRSSAEVLLTIINDILDISKMEAGKLLIHPAVFDLRRTLDDVATLLAPRAFDKGIEVIVRYAPGAPQRINGDAVRIRQVLTNLIGNAIKFTAAGHVLVQVKEVAREGNVSQIKFSVTDTGIGISPDALPRLFQNFEQEDSSTSRKFGGTGLGLAISRQLVELMGGKLEVTSKLDHGSTFSYTLTLEVADQDFDQEVAPIDLTGLRILAVDDHPVNREVLSDMFNAWGLQHDEVESGEEALKALRQAVVDKRPYDVALLDFQMPGMDGIFLATAIHAEPEINDVIMLMLSSASFNDNQQRELAMAGVAGQLLKPLRQFELREVLGNAVNARGGDLTEAVKTAPIEKKSLPAFMPPAQTSALRVLLAEDNEVNIEIARDMLTNLGFSIDCALNGVEAVSMAKKNSYDIIFMDCQMPEMDGFDATKAIRKSVAESPPIIIAMTAHAMAGDRERCLDCGMDDYLAKPVTFMELSRVTGKYAEIIAQRKTASATPAKQSYPLFDLQAALAVTGGNRDVLRKATAIWWRKMPDWLTELKTGFQRGDVRQIQQVAHTMRGAAANIGAISISKAAEHMETQVTTENLRDMAHSFDHLVLDIERLRSVVIEDAT